MGFEDKKDNKVDTKRNGRPVSFSMGDGQDLYIDLPESIPGQEDMATDDSAEVSAKDLSNKLNKTTKEIEDLLKSVGIDDVSKILNEDN
ncbi:hypothetical protein [Anaerococcus sp. Marseille-Q7828]|uniref:hypothetical protein n=1 Tax=Anaerococcus sp. Marseille-Q7828 TaxID=3036300 RepID=UPI0024ADD553|nr:hypothetical protein [Anaerococcus sp. Marseille-Q7828]